MAAYSHCNLDTFDGFLNTTGQNIYMLTALCKTRIRDLKLHSAGGFGPPTIRELNSAMCSSECITADRLHQVAMESSHCSCSQLSTDSFIKNDFCKQNSARYLCELLSECGTWNCKLEDYNCMRYEWDSTHTCAGSVLTPSWILILLALYLLNV
uniref:Uncharacterized protein AlNc14C73G4990 n=1 Tax=Albugo laibachii Nc14 TaxID=890382 RepID=F0WED3_9STRA|nr:conserved hypothetical protein [Albugo laibachii Nc14]|eukprot:CCA19565.1 conserved hypothetical protein [Albugo laibachii Nc14]